MKAVVEKSFKEVLVRAVSSDGTKIYDSIKDYESKKNKETAERIVNPIKRINDNKEALHEVFERLALISKDCEPELLPQIATAMCEVYGLLY